MRDRARCVPDRGVNHVPDEAGQRQCRTGNGRPSSPAQGHPAAVLAQEMSPVSDGVRLVKPPLKFVVQVRD